MKKIMTLVALAAMMMGVASCSDDGPVREDKLSYGVTDLMTKTVTGDTYFDYAGSKLRFDLNYLADTACLRVLDTKFAERQPVTVNLLFDGMKINYSARDRYTLTGTSYNVMDYQVKDISCNVNMSNKMFYLTYTVVSERATSQVYVYPSTILSALADDNLDYANANETFYTFKCNMNNEGGYEGSVMLHNVQFQLGESSSPKMTIRIPYDEHSTVTGTATGYTIEGTGITGFWLQGTTEVPFDRSTVDDLKIEVDVVNKSYSIYFKCMGGEYNAEGKLYL